MTHSLRYLGVVASAAAWACSSPTGPSLTPAPGGPAVPAIVDCARFPDSGGSTYVLPLPVGRTFRVTRTFDHYTPLNRGVGLYAIDIDMPIGTPVHAIRAGIVIAVEERFTDDDHGTYQENWVMIRHADGTVARYIHLTVNGASVEVGETVAQGQLVGRSGNSGDSRGPHLHFDVQTCGPNLPPGYNDLPCGMTVPLSFRNAQPHSCGLEPGKSYAALPFVPDGR